MCGVLGIIVKQRSVQDPDRILEAISSLIKLSSSRGQEGAGVAIHSGGAIEVLKSPIKPARFVRHPQYSRFMARALAPLRTGASLAAIGHTRLATHGAEHEVANNQPVVRGDHVCAHNGIIANHAELWSSHPQLRRQMAVDTEVFIALYEHFLATGKNELEAVAETYAQIQGTASVAMLSARHRAVLLSTNTGSLYTCISQGGDLMVFASERSILNRFCKQREAGRLFRPADVAQVRAGQVWLVEPEGLVVNRFDLETIRGGRTRCSIEQSDRVPIRLEAIQADIPVSVFASRSSKYTIRPHVRAAMERVWERTCLHSPMRRCSRCLLPESFPSMEFDDQGVCFLCRQHQQRRPSSRDPEELNRILAPHRGDGSNPDCIVPFSGGRDSVWGLHYIKKVLGLNPIAYTYDWGVLSDLGRRNQARQLGKLGVEHIIVSADIRRKRDNINKNLRAWLKKPELGMVPLFMAGDKPHIYHAARLMRELDIGLCIFSCGGFFEDVGFKVGFTGVDISEEQGLKFLSKNQVFQAACYYGAQILSNLSYVNRSIADSFWGFLCMSVLSGDPVHLYEFVDWREDEILDLIRSEYDWETASDTVMTWRIDDGTVPFYNYIYMAMAGFSENDAFRSGQIRAGHLTREQAERLVREENRPRYESLEWYAQLIDIDINDAIGRINAAPRLYQAD